MSSSASKSRIQEELKAKRERIALLRKQKEARQAAARSNAAASSTAATPAVSAGDKDSSTVSASKADDIDNLLSSVDSILGSKPSDTSTTDGTASGTAENSGASTSATASSSSGITSSGASGAGGVTSSSYAGKKQHQLGESRRIAEVTVPPVVREMYSKEVQAGADHGDLSAILSGGADGQGLSGSSSHGASSASDSGSKNAQKSGDGGSGDSKDEDVAEELTPLEKETIMSSPSFAQFITSASSTFFGALGEPVRPITEMQPKERSEVESLSEFSDFLRHSSRVMERALGNRFDPVVNYAAGDSAADDAAGGGTAAEKVKLMCTFFDDRWCRHRIVTDVGWSPHHPELIVASYGAKEDTVSQDPDGVAIVWSVNLEKRPEFVFNAQSAVTAVTYSAFASHFLVGATYSGQVVLWDNRAGSSMPVQRTPISSTGHTHPVYGVQVVGTQNAHSLVTVSTDGHVCVWSMDMLVTPQDTIDLVRPSGAMGKDTSSMKLKDASSSLLGSSGSASSDVATSKAGSSSISSAAAAAARKDKFDGVSASCLGFPEGEVNAFLVGTEEGAIYECYRHGEKQGVAGRIEAHFGPITSIDVHPIGSAPSGADHSHLFLTSSIDWTCKLWSRRSVTAEPLASVEHAADYVYQARWSPVHPAIFATVDGAGNLDIWNVTKDLEVPVVRTVVGDNAAALNTLRWSPDGRKLAVGDSHGTVFVFEIAPELALPAHEDWKAFEAKIIELENAAQSISGAR